ncbi:MAG: heme biosynthesis HemY N-terminal domain-containing protein [Hydrogenophaga sp.]|uniref:heme biosynthesis HemY N-terminal domain-containing protein n=1 Tax=Hydrogenophaga sp. TaxID=1904254 RepID=UPI000EF0BA0B|nr:heme biosynthesis HemY N-terminal domain-containing protein [Hydrogenophaga sp.]MDX9967973.1 heme biosynthesis HemY N-terminal domain-containing protein [Hydrogenophaga sp.]HAJ13601.1 heme biosynthesis protein HemY [Comamonadaceae bacterium]
MRRPQQQGAMRGVIWLLAMAAMAMALALLMGDNHAIVSLFWPPYRLDASFNLVLAVLLLSFVVFYVGLRGIARLRELPGRAREWRSRQLTRSAISALMDALSFQLAGRFVRAHASAKQALQHMDDLQEPSAGIRIEQMRLLANLLAAESAQALQNRTSRDDYLGAALQPALAKSAADAHEGALLRAVRWAVEDRNIAVARARLAELPHGAGRRIQALRLRLRVAQLDSAVTEALEVARLLNKHRAFSPEAGRSLLRGLALDALRQAHDLAQLQAVWEKLAPSEKTMPELALAAAEQANALMARPPDVTEEDRLASGRQVLAWLEPIWPQVGSLDAAEQRRLVLVIEPALADLDSTWLSRIERLQQEQPGNPCWQYLVGQACMHRRLWGKAAMQLGQARHGLKDPILRRRTWCALARLAEQRGDAEAALAAWQTAAQVE